ncbi:hypothetical protein GCM10027578_00020 [Spirosoma luteolum]
MNSAPRPDSLHALQACHAQHQTWASTLRQSEQEIDQLLTLLADLPGPDAYHSLNHPADAYAQALGRLKNRIHDLQTDMVCTGTACTAVPATSTRCADPHFSMPVAGNSLIGTVSAEYVRLKERCQSFLSELMGLNLI